MKNNNEFNTKLFEYFVLEDILFDENKLPQGDENLIPTSIFCGMLVEAAIGGCLTLEEVMKVVNLQK